MDEKLVLLLLFLFVLIIYLIFAHNDYQLLIVIFLFFIFVVLYFIFIKLYQIYQLMCKKEQQVSDRQPGIIEYYTENFNNIPKRHRRYRSVARQ